MKDILRRIQDRIKKKTNITIARERGVRIGEECLILADPYICFGSEPYLVELGDHVEVTNGCQFVTHDGAVWTLRNDLECAKIDKFGKIKVGNNVFIGINSIILPGVTIADNCIIGAGSIVTKSIPEGEVWAGAPARFISTVEQYKKSVLLNADYTKGLSAKDKKEKIIEKHPEWFQ